MAMLISYYCKRAVIFISIISLLFLLEYSNATLVLNDNENDEKIKLALQEGGIAWLDLNVAARARGSDDKMLLHKSSGFIPNGHLCGVIGPSGSGKSTFLAALSGTTLRSTKLKVSGHVWMMISENNNHDIDDSRCYDDISDKNDSYDYHHYYLSTKEGDVAFLQQEDVFFSMLTPYETLSMAARLQLPANLEHSERQLVVQKLMDSLGLGNEHVQHRRVGDRAVGGEGAGGLSGGERRRLSVAIELITTPKLLLADEPTTGLDSTQAEKVMSIIAKVSKEKRIPSICTLHQPRASIWKKLDSFILLAPGGRVAYVGSRENAQNYFSKLGYNCPPETNPAEYFIDLVSIDTEDPEQALIDNKRINFLEGTFSSHIEHLKNQAGIMSSLWKPSKIAHKDPSKYISLSSRKQKVGMLQRFSHLFIRSWRQNIRDIKLNMLRFGASLGQALLFAQIFKSVDKGNITPKSVSDRIALLTYGVINMSMLALLKAVELFSREKNVITRERIRNQYTGAEYLLSKVLAEFPLDALFAIVFASTLKWCTGLRCSLKVLASTYSLMTLAGASLGFAIGSFAPNADAAKTAGLPIMVVLMVLGVINPSGVDSNETQPIIIRLLKLSSPIKWAVEALCVAEFRGIEFVKQTRRGIFRTLVSDAPKMGALALVQNGDQVLDALGLTNITWESSMKALGKLTGVNLLLAFLGLTFCGPKFIGPHKYHPVDDMSGIDILTKDNLETIKRSDSIVTGSSLDTNGVNSVPIVRGFR